MLIDSHVHLQDKRFAVDLDRKWRPESHTFARPLTVKPLSHTHPDLTDNYAMRRTSFAFVALSASLVAALAACRDDTLVDLTGGGHAWALWSNRLDGSLRYFSDHLARPRP